MKKFTKLFLSCAAVAAVTAAVATSAMADGDATTYPLSGSEKISGSYDPATGIVSITTAYDDATKTLVILKPAEVETASTEYTVEAENIVAIDQNATITEAKLNASEIDPVNKTYTVLMGGIEGQVYVATFGKSGSNQLLGDVDNNTLFNGIDASLILKHAARIETLTGDALQAADADDTGIINGVDASTVLKHVAKIDTTKLGTKTISDKQNSVN